MKSPIQTTTRGPEALELTTTQLYKLSEAFKSISQTIDDETLQPHLFRMSAKMWAYADRRRRANEEQAQAFEFSVRRVRSLKSTGVVS